MNQNNINAVTRTVSGLPSRRDVIRGLAAAGIGLGCLQVPKFAEAKKSKHKKRKTKKVPQPVFNQYGCVDVGQPCRGNSSLCCSGICQGTKPKKGKKDMSRCAAHNTGICAVDSDSCSAGGNVACNSSNPACFCTRTTGNAGFCGDFTAGVVQLCRVCTRDTDCEAEFGKGAACLLLGGACTNFCGATGRTACVPPCAA